MPVTLIGAPVGVGAGQRGAEAGPRALRAAGLRDAIAAGGRAVADAGDLACAPPAFDAPARAGLKALSEVGAWAAAIRKAARSFPPDALPVFLGGDHSLSLGSVAGLAERAARMGRPFHVLWIDAHPDCHTLDTTQSGHLHGTPVAHALGEPGFAPWFAPLGSSLRPENLMMLGIRDVDEAEAAFIARKGLRAHSPEAVRRHGPAALLASWLDRIRDTDGLLHVSLDADALDPSVAPGVGTPVAQGLTLDEVRETLAVISGAGVLGSMDLVEVNPFLDREQRTARAVVELAVEALRPAARAAGVRRSRA